MPQQGGSGGGGIASNGEAGGDFGRGDSPGGDRGLWFQEIQQKSEKPYPWVKSWVRHGAMG